MTGIESWGGGSRRAKKNPTKLELVSTIAKNFGVKVLDLTALNVEDLLEIKKVSCKDYTPPPNLRSAEGSLKDPYITEIRKVFPTLYNLKKLSVHSLDQLLKVLLHAH